SQQLRRDGFSTPKGGFVIVPRQARGRSAVRGLSNARSGTGIAKGRFGQDNAFRPPCCRSGSGGYRPRRPDRHRPTGVPFALVEFAGLLLALFRKGWPIRTWQRLGPTRAGGNQARGD